MRSLSDAVVELTGAGAVALPGVAGGDVTDRMAAAVPMAVTVVARVAGGGRLLRRGGGDRCWGGWRRRRRSRCVALPPPSVSVAMAAAGMAEGMAVTVAVGAAGCGRRGRGGWAATRAGGRLAVMGPGGASLPPASVTLTAVSVTLTPGMPMRATAVPAAGVPGGRARVGDCDQAETAGTQYQA